MHRTARQSEKRTFRWRRLFVGRLIAAALIALSLTRAVSAEEDAAVAEFVTRINQSVFALGAAQGYERAQAVCLTLLRSVLNVDAMASSISAGSWTGMTPQQRASFRTVVENRISRDCARNRGNRDESLTLVGVRRGNDGARLIATRWGAADAGRTVIWRVHSGSDQRLRAIDVLLDGRSLVISLTAEVREMLERTNGNIDALLSAF